MGLLGVEADWPAVISVSLESGSKICESLLARSSAISQHCYTILTDKGITLSYIVTLRSTQTQITLYRSSLNTCIYIINYF